MTPDRQKRIAEIYDAVSQPGVTDRHAFLVVACGSDTELQREVESLLVRGDLKPPSAGDPVSGSNPPAPSVTPEAIREGASLGPYDVVRVLGQGGMGVVYEAHDRERQIRVALKSLSGFGPRALRLFKNEFRALSGISHPNLATLYELVFCEGQWLFSMEYVEGGHFLEYVRPGGTLPEDDPANSPDAETIALDYDDGVRARAIHEAVPRPEPIPPAPRTHGGRCDIDRLASCMTQLTSAVLALHSEGILHRDLKPLNVKVTPEGRVVVLDFGLATHAAAESFGDDSMVGGVVGTVSYMSPEQAAGERATEAADWYAVGVMLYEALTGRRPFEGPPGNVLKDKRRLEAPRVRLGAGVSPVWREICAGLLERDPTRRLSGRELLFRLQQLTGTDALAAEMSGMSPEPRGVPGVRRFFGREPHLTLLREAFAGTYAGRPAVVLVDGPSGIGKSALIEKFLSEITIAGERPTGPMPVVLTGRCYERESMPYKAFDGVIDKLAKYMAALPRHEAAAITPRDASALAQVFPVLKQAEAITMAPSRAAYNEDQYDVRRKAFSALRELLSRLGDRRRVVIWVDDLQWGDIDSATLLREVLRPPDTPALLLIASYRSDHLDLRSEFSRRAEAHERNAVLTTILESLPGEPDVSRRRMSVGPLTDRETRQLAENLLGSAANGHDPRVEKLASESEGSPYLLQEIAAGMETGAGGSRPGTSLDELLYQRVSALPDVARSVTEVVALAARPISEREAFRAAGLPAQDPGVLVMLRAGRLIRGVGGGDDIEPYHDRVRETVVARLSDEHRAERHRALAETFEETLLGGGCPDAEAVAVHFEAAGERTKASHYYLAASDTACAALAFKHGAELCQKAFDLSTASGEERRLLLVKLADALAQAGLGPRAARAYRSAAIGAKDDELFDLESKEAYWFASSGHVDEGQDAMAKMLKRIGRRLPGRLRRIAGIFSCVVWLRLRGVKFRPRPLDQISRADLHRVDVLWNVASGYGMVDTPTGIYAVGQCVRAAFRAGDPRRVARALALYAVGSSAIPVPVRSPVPEVLAACREICRETNDPYLNGLLRVAEGFLEFFRGHWRSSVQRMDEAERILAKECGGVALELAMVRVFLLWNLLYSGHYQELSRRAPLWAQEGNDRGDLFQTTSINMGTGPVVELIAGRPDAALQMLDDALEGWTRRYINLQHASGTYIRAWIYLYRGEPDAALAFLNLQWPALRLNLYHRLGGIRQWLYSTHGQSALAVAVTADDPGPLLRTAETDAKNLEQDEEEFAHALAKLIRAGCASLRGEKANAVETMEKAVAQLEALDMLMMAESARRNLGLMMGGPAGQAVVERADAAMKVAGVSDPVRLSAVFVNGCLPAA